MFWTVLKEMGVILGGSAIAVAAVAWLTRTLFTHLLSKDVETFKTQIKAAADKELESVRNDLKMRALEHEVRFSKLHDKQAKIIAITYSQLFELYSRLASFVSIIDFANEPDKEGKLKLLSESVNKFKAFFYPRRIYFPKDTFDKIDKFFGQVVQVANKFADGLRAEKSGDYSNHGFWTEGFDAVKKEVQPLFHQVHEDFQSLLGVSGINRA